MLKIIKIKIINQIIKIKNKINNNKLINNKILNPVLKIMLMIWIKVKRNN